MDGENVRKTEELKFYLGFTFDLVLNIKAFHSPEENFFSLEVMKWKLAFLGEGISIKTLICRFTAELKKFLTKPNLML